MVLWEITLGTAYFLGLKRTYRLALKIQRRLIGPKHPRIRQFLHRRTRMVFDVALKVHRNIQERDIEVGRDLGNWILRWLNRMKPSAQIRVSDKTRSTPSTNMNMTKQVKGTTNWKSPGSFNTKSGESDRHMFTSLSSTWQKPFPAISMMMRSAKPLGNMTQYRHLNICQPEVPRLPSAGGGFDGVIRKDIMQWMLKK